LPASRPSWLQLRRPLRLENRSRVLGVRPDRGDNRSRVLSARNTIYPRVIDAVSIPCCPSTDMKATLIQAPGAGRVRPAEPAPGRRRARRCGDCVVADRRGLLGEPVYKSLRRISLAGPTTNGLVFRRRSALNPQVMALGPAAADEHPRTQLPSGSFAGHLSTSSFESTKTNVVPKIPVCALPSSRHNDDAAPVMQTLSICVLLDLRCGIADLSPNQFVHDGGVSAAKGSITTPERRRFSVDA